MAITVYGIEVRHVSTQDALIYLSIGRTKFYDLVKRLNVRPITAGNRSLWKPSDLDLIAEEIERLGE